ncbi:S49 family peptidase [Microvirga sp. W0021]|uniref:S49 family peptidase n=1 Tax=Hohaiivirga grylli TaxID=3133970 RepID=A0ABV0BLH1_9HYPH
MQFVKKTLGNLEALLPKRFRSKDPRVAVIRMNGAIGMAQPLRAGLSAAGVSPLLEKAFNLPRAKAVAIIINSPGGAPAQAHLIYQRIKSLAAEKELPVFIFVEDVAASGGYMIACAGDEIYADPTSIVGSIGVVSAGFGFDRFIEKHGIDRRVHTSGKSKAMLDPFHPENPDDIAHLKNLQEQIHIFFKDLVREGRKDKLKADEDFLFSGSFWVGAEALNYGLIDGLGNIHQIMREKYGEKVKLNLLSPPKPSLLGRLLGKGAQVEMSLIQPEALISAVEERSLWARFGLWN